MSWLSAMGFGRETRQYDNEFNEQNICGFTAMNERGEQVGTVSDYVLDGNGKLRYLVITTGDMYRGKKITVPVGTAQIEDRRNSVILNGFNADRIQSLPEYDENRGFSDRYESDWMSSYSPNQQLYTDDTGRLDYDRYNEFKTPERLQLLEERLQVNKRSELQGEVRIGKRVETRQESVDVPVTRERLVVERNPVTETTADAGDMTLQDQEITVPLYREEVDVTKRPVVAEEVNIRKERDTETRTVTEQVGRERLDIDDPAGLTRDQGERGIPGNIRDDASTTGRQKGKVKVDVIPLDDK